MTEYVVEVGPGGVRGPCDVAQKLVSTALEFIDDEIALLDDQPVAVAAVWCELLRSVLPDGDQTVVLVCPTWWAPVRVERVQQAAETVSANVIVRQRSAVIADGVPGTPSVVEIGPDFVAISRSGCLVAAEPRLGDCADVARAVADGVVGSSAVLVDAPVGVHDAVALARAIAECLRADGVAVTTVHQDRVLEVVRDPPTSSAHRVEAPGRRTPRVVAASVVASAALLCVGLAVGSDVDGTPATDVPMTLLVEGRIAATVPAQWVIRRITAGPGSARVQVTAPDGATAVLITQARVREGESLSLTAATLRRVLDDQQAGVFDQFDPDARRADRPAVTYREIRQGRQIDWAVFVDDTVRIGVGCQSAPGSEQVVRFVCEEAIRSAHSVF